MQKQKLDVFNHEKNWIAFKEQLTPKYIEGGLSKENSKLFVSYLLDMEQGVNIPKNSPKGARDVKTINRLRSKMRAIFKLLQDFGDDPAERSSSSGPRSKTPFLWPSSQRAG